MKLFKYFMNFFKKKSSVEQDEYAQIIKELNQEKKALQKQDKIERIKEEIAFEKELRNLELEEKKLKILELKAELSEDMGEDNNTMSQFMQMMSMLPIAPVQNQAPQETKGGNEDFSQTNDFIKTINSLPNEKFEKLKLMVSKL